MLVGGFKTRFPIQEPGCGGQHELVEAYRAEERIHDSLRSAFIADDVQDMDRRRVQKAQKRALDISRVRLAAIGTVLQRDYPPDIDEARDRPRDDTDGERVAEPAVIRAMEPGEELVGQLAEFSSRSAFSDEIDQVADKAKETGLFGSITISISFDGSATSPGADAAPAG